MHPLSRLPLGTDDAYCYVDAELADWFVAGGRLRGRPEARFASTGTEGAPTAAATLSEAWLYTNADCNLTCRHCFIEDRGERPTLEALVERASQALALGARTLYLTGGEPFLRPDLEELVAALIPRATVVILTNATLVTPRRLASLEEKIGARKDGLAFHVSIDGPAGVHDSVRGAGAFRRAVRGIESLRDWGRAPAVTTALNALTVSSAHDVTRIAASLGCRVHHLFLPHVSGRLSCSPRRLPAAPALLDAIRRCRKAASGLGVTIANDAAIASRVRRPGRRFEHCNGGSETVAFGTDGAVFPCPTLVGESRFAENAPDLATALGGPPLAAFRAASIDQRPSCASCEVRFFCGGGCAAHAYRSGGALESAEPYCEVYRGLIDDHLTDASRELIEGLDGDLAGDAILRPPMAAAPAHHVRFGCT